MSAIEILAVIAIIGYVIYKTGSRDRAAAIRYAHQHGLG